MITLNFAILLIPSSIYKYIVFHVTNQIDNPKRNKYTNGGG